MQWIYLHFGLIFILFSKCVLVGILFVFGVVLAFVLYIFLCTFLYNRKLLILLGFRRFLQTLQNSLQPIFLIST